ncbi:AAA family ATPase [Spirochaetales bacterium NM-380-WT-3C1]|uniref:AAA family ATPase n=1 Tax=Bullifex porci TaxID=2606638 RepID=A0A7X2TRM8_9SPIO|nr:AAA family ATPase [Bullifex porci]
METRGISDGLVIIDEIQKIPELLDEVHLLIEETNIRFLLTSSSARRLKEQEVNLLGGRAGKMNLHPFVWPEIKEFNPTLDRILKNGRLSNSEHFFFRNYGEFRKKYLSVLNKILF